MPPKMKRAKSRTTRPSMGPKGLLRTLKHKQKKVKLPMRGNGVLRKTGKSPVMTGRSANANPRTSLNPGNIDPSPAPSLRANYTMDRYKRVAPINPRKLQAGMRAQAKAYSNVPAVITSKKVYKNGM